MGRSASIALLVALATIALCCNSAFAHGGGLHTWTFNKEVPKVVKSATVRPLANLQLATCSKWVVMNTTAVRPAFTLPFFPPTVNLTISGTVDVYSYLGGNCTNSSQWGMFPMLKFESVRKRGNRWVPSPYGAGDKATFAYGFEGYCSAPGNIYRNNATLGDSRFNIAWWNAAENVIGTGTNATNGAPGYLWGASVNAWFPRRPTGRAGESALQSVVVIPEGGPLFCCNFEWTKNAEDVLKENEAKKCDGPAPH